MIKRNLQEKISASLKQFPVVGIIGSRQTGKTTLAKLFRKQHANSVYLDLELPSDQNKLREPELYLGRHRDALVIIDEIQRIPSLFPIIRALVDQNRVPGRFLVGFGFARHDQEILGEPGRSRHIPRTASISTQRDRKPQ